MLKQEKIRMTAGSGFGDDEKPGMRFPGIVVAWIL